MKALHVYHYLFEDQATELVAILKRVDTSDSVRATPVLQG